MPAAHSRVRRAREVKSLTQAGLAARVGLSRQALAAIEAGRSVPSVDVAIRLGRVLGMAVEALFAGCDTPWVEAEFAQGGGADRRVVLVHLADRWVAHRLGADGMHLAADGVTDDGPGPRVRLLRPEVDARANLAVAGCASAIGVISDRLNAHPGAGRFIWIPKSSTGALDALMAGTVHVAGVHLVDNDTGEANLVDLRRTPCAFPLTVVTLARWEVGLVFAASNPMGIAAISDITRPGVRVVSREVGSGARRVLDRSLRGAGIPPSVPGADVITAAGHPQVARIVHAGAADVGIATLDTAIAYGLGFIPLAEERFDLVFDRGLRHDPRIARFLDELTSASCRLDLGALGYDMREAGAHVADLAA